MKQLFLFITILVLNGFLSEKACAQEVSVILTTDESFSNRAIIDKMQRNLSQVLTEINRAQKENRLLNTVGLALDDLPTAPCTCFGQISTFIATMKRW